MNGSTSPAPQPRPVEPEHGGEAARLSLSANSPEPVQQQPGTGDGPASPARPLSAQKQRVDEDAASAKVTNGVTNGGDDEAASEAETLIDSPVKKREAQKQQPKPARSRIGGLPVPGEDDEESESVATPMQSTEVSDAKVASSADAKDTADEMDMGSDKEDSSGSLSSAPSPAPTSVSMVSGQSRALSEGPKPSRNGAELPNPRKRKHRASSVGLPNKRRSMEPPKRNLRTMHSEDNAGRAGRSPSPPRSHRRAISTQSAMDGVTDNTTNKRKSVTQHFPVREPKTARTGWEESDASSETTSLGQAEARRPQRGIGRSTSTPGRPVGREHKRHINKYGFTRLAEACEANHLDLVKDWREKDPDQLELAEFAHNKPLQIAAVHGNAEIVEYLIDQGCQIDCANVDKDTPLIDAAENGHLEVVKILLKAGVDPLRQNLKGQQALDVVTDDNDEAYGIRAALRSAIESWTSDDARQRREEEEEARHKAGPSKELHFMARTYDNLLRLVMINDRNGVKEFLDARVPVDNKIIAAAAKTGDQYLVNMLLAEMNPKKAHKQAEKPMLAVLGTSHFDMVKMLTELDQFKPDWTNRLGQTWAEQAEAKNGPNRRQEKGLLQRLYDAESKSMVRRRSSPVTKRDGVKRRLPQHQEDEEESDEDEGPKPKNSRRLLSRRAMRAASGKAASDDTDSEEGSTSDTGTGLITEPPERETATRPPDSPAQKRGSVARQRTKHLSSTHPGEISPRTHRRSSSLRGPQDQPLPTVEEKVEDKDAMEHDQAKRAKFLLQQAQALEAKRREAEVAEAEAKRAEEARKADEERKAEEARVEAEAARKRMEEEQVREAERERKAEEERRREEAEMEGARGAFRRGVLAKLPNALAKALDPESDFQYSGDDAKDHLLEYCTPLLTLGELPEDISWVLGIQAAPLLGKRGIELLLPRDHELGFERTFCSMWETRTFSGDHERARLQCIVHELAIRGPLHEEDASDDLDMDDAAAFQAEVKRTTHRHSSVQDVKQALNDGTVALECVQLQDVLSNVDPLLAGCPIEVRHLELSKWNWAARVGLEERGNESFVGRLRESWEQMPVTQTFVDGKETEGVSVTGTTPVVIVHEK